MPIESQSVSVTVAHELSVRRIADLLCAALEGGIGYWCSVKGYELADGLEFDDFKEGGKFQFKDDYFHPYELIPLVSGCALLLQDNEEDKVYRLTYDNIKRGLQRMADQYPKHFANILNENEDAETADVFVQCAVLGEITYG